MNLEKELSSIFHTAGGTTFHKEDSNSVEAPSR